MSSSLSFIISFVIIINCAASFPAQERGGASAVEGGSLSELRNKHRLWLIVRRGAVLDVSGVENSILSEVYRDVDSRQTFPRTYNTIVRKLNKYMKEYGSITAAQSLGEADFILFFNVLEIRRPLGTPYAYGELFVILNTKSNPRVLWKTRSSGKFVDDAVSDFISELKAARGER